MLESEVSEVTHVKLMSFAMSDQFQCKSYKSDSRLHRIRNLCNSAVSPSKM